MQSQSPELWLILIFGIVASLSLVIGIIAIIMISQKRMIGAQEERLAEIEKREKENLRLVDELTRLKATLEERVKSRTEELENSLEKLKQAQAQLVLSEKMASLGSLVAGTAHEFNNPLSIISGNLRFLEEYFDFYKRVLTASSAQSVLQKNDATLHDVIADSEKTMTSCTHAVQRLVKLVNSLRQFAHIDDASITEVNIHDELDNILQLSVVSRFPVVRIERKYSGHAQIVCYAGDMVQVLMNLLINACESIERRMQQNALPPGVLSIVTEKAAEGTLRISVIDNGSGIDPSIQNRIFDPFFSTKPIGQGVGLSLATSYRIVQKHNGRMYFHTTPSLTTFTLELPVYQKSF